MTRTADVVICGAGIAGIAAAHALAVVHGIRRVVLVDALPPMTLTSDKSTEAYRNWWPGPDDSMVRFMNRSIDLLDQWADASGNQFLLNRRGYVYATSSEQRGAELLADARLAEAQGAGEVRMVRSLTESSAYQPSAHRGYRDHPDGADVFTDQAAIRAHFPFLSPTVRTVVHARRCGWMSGQQLGMYLLEKARAAGVEVIAGRVVSVDCAGGAVRGVHIAASDGSDVHVSTPVFVNSGGPLAREVGALAEMDLPLFSELHLKVAFEDTLGAIDRNTGLVILDDAQSLSWSDEERDELASSDETRWLTQPMPAGIHLRPEGYGASTTVLMLWDYHSAHRYAAPVFPLPEDVFYPEVVMRGMVALAPALAPYTERLPHMYLDGGYYTKTEENRPLVGPAGVSGAYVNAAFSGYGLMAAPAAAEMLAAYIVGGALPSYARAFRLDRYDDPAYRERVAAWGSTGQL